MKDNADISKISKRSKPRINSRNKGNTFERKIASQLNDRFTTEDFCRSPGSGAFATTHKLPKHMKLYGDLITPQNFNFTIECKKGYNKENLCSFFKPNSEIRKFIKQAEKDAKYAEREPMIIIKQDRSITIVIVKNNTYTSDIENKLIWREYIICSLDDLLRLNDNYFLSQA